MEMENKDNKPQFSIKTIVRESDDKTFSLGDCIERLNKVEGLSNGRIEEFYFDLRGKVNVQIKNKFGEFFEFLLSNEIDNIEHLEKEGGQEFFDASFESFNIISIRNSGDGKEIEPLFIFDKIPFDAEIISIERRVDGEIFSIGDKIREQGQREGKIESFQLSKGYVRLNMSVENRVFDPILRTYLSSFSFPLNAHDNINQIKKITSTEEGGDNSEEENKEESFDSSLEDINLQKEDNSIIKNDFQHFKVDSIKKGKKPKGEYNLSLTGRDFKASDRILSVKRISDGEIFSVGSHVYDGKHSWSLEGISVDYSPRFLIFHLKALNGIDVRPLFEDQFCQLSKTEKKNSRSLKIKGEATIDGVDYFLIPKKDGNSNEEN